MPLSGRPVVAIHCVFSYPGWWFRFFGHVAIADYKQDYHQIISASHWPPNHCRRPQGRPCTIWLRGINTDAQSANICIHSAWRKTNDRTLWRCIMDMATFHHEACQWKTMCGLEMNCIYSYSLVICTVQKNFNYCHKALTIVQADACLEWPQIPRTTLCCKNLSHLLNITFPSFTFLFCHITLHPTRAIKSLYSQPNPQQYSTYTYPPTVLDTPHA